MHAVAVDDVAGIVASHTAHKKLLLGFRLASKWSSSSLQLNVVTSDTF
jgi:hypothetical protein